MLSSRHEVHGQRGRARPPTPASSSSGCWSRQPDTLGIGAIIGTGIFSLTGQPAAQYAGPGIV